MSGPRDRCLSHLRAAIDASTTRWTEITTLRPQDATRELAHDMAREVSLSPAGTSWNGPLASMLTSEVARFWGALYDLPEAGEVAFLSGSSEALLIALFCARERAKQRGATGRMTVARPTSGHPAIDKAARYLDLDVTALPLDAQCRCDLDALGSVLAERDDVAIVVAALPSDCHGVCDPVPEMAEICARHGVWFHVDGALGGALVPFLAEIGAPVPDCGFTVDGVTSIGIGLHKYGYAPIGVAALLFGDADDAALRRIDMSDWDGAAMVGERVAGLCSLDKLAGAWSVIQALGAEGYRDRAAGILRNQNALADMIEAIDGLTVLATPEAGVLTFDTTADDGNAFARAFAARGHRGKVIQSPGGFVVCVGPNQGPDDLQTYRDEIHHAVQASLRADRS